jgi:hypothetical protein
VLGVSTPPFAFQPLEAYEWLKWRESAGIHGYLALPLASTATDKALQIVYF